MKTHLDHLLFLALDIGSITGRPVSASTADPAFGDSWEQYQSTKAIMIGLPLPFTTREQNQLAAANQIDLADVCDAATLTRSIW